MFGQFGDVNYCVCAQASGAVELNVGKCVDEGVIANETLGYFIARTYLYLKQVCAFHCSGHLPAGELIEVLFKLSSSGCPRARFPYKCSCFRY